MKLKNVGVRDWRKRYIVVDLRAQDVIEGYSTYEAALFAINELVSEENGKHGRYAIARMEVVEYYGVPMKWTAKLAEITSEAKHEAD